MRQVHCRSSISRSQTATNPQLASRSSSANPADAASPGRREEEKTSTGIRKADLSVILRSDDKADLRKEIGKERPAGVKKASTWAIGFFPGRRRSLRRTGKNRPNERSRRRAIKKTAAFLRRLVSFSFPLSGTVRTAFRYAS
jgi:hypothetical protein